MAASLVALAPAVLAFDSKDDEIQSISIVGTAFEITLGDGSVLSGEDLRGAVFSIGDAAGSAAEIRIDDLEIDPEDGSGEIVLYTLSIRDPSSDEWRNLCEPDPDGLRRGFPLSGSWTTTGEHVRAEGAFTITCTSGVSGKCVRMGYKPWKTNAEGISLWDYHQACTRMLRADYCGTGQPYTREGTPIVVYDGLGIQRDEPDAGMSFEAGWDADGAVCVRRVRIPENVSLEALVRTCPTRLEGNVGEGCTEERALQSKTVLLLNKS